ncbi:MAG TPA: hypothetical protein PK402_10675 [Tepidisphaeraceae bacterium]|nr:hypothetical protein [Tepidisphaeraceae bacterium]
MLKLFAPRKGFDPVPLERHHKYVSISTHDGMPVAKLFEVPAGEGVRHYVAEFHPPFAKCDFYHLLSESDHRDLRFLIHFDDGAKAHVAECNLWPDSNQDRLISVTRADCYYYQPRPGFPVKPIERRGMFERVLNRKSIESTLKMSETMHDAIYAMHETGIEDALWAAQRASEVYSRTDLDTQLAIVRLFGELVRCHGHCDQKMIEILSNAEKETRTRLSEAARSVFTLIQRFSVEQTKD